MCQAKIRRVEYNMSSLVHIVRILRNRPKALKKYGSKHEIILRGMSIVELLEPVELIVDD